MIPTRVRQQYKEGSLMGFNPKTGKLLIVANRSTYIEYYLPHERDQVYQQSLANYPQGCSQPTVDDFKAIKIQDIVRCIAVSGCALSNVRHRQEDFAWFVTCNVVGRKSKPLYRLVVINNYSSEVGQVKLFSTDAASNDGYLCPVLRINGSNCESV